MYFARSMPFKIANKTGCIGRFNNKMYVIQHKNKTIEFEIFILLTITKRFGNNIPTIMSIKKIVPFFDGESEKINGRV